MRRLILFLLILIFSVWVGLEVLRHPGYLLFVYQPWMVQMPVWVALISALIIFLLFYLFINSIAQIQFSFYRLKNWLYFRREHRSYTKTQHGLSALIEGRFKKAEGLLMAGVHQTLDPLINYLAAAKAAHEQKAYERRDAYIQKAYKVAPKANLAIGLTQAELELNQGQFEHAKVALIHLLRSSPRQPRVLKLLEKVYVHLGDWKSVQALVPSMRKAKLLTAEQAELFEKNVYVEMLQSSKNGLEVQAVWQPIPRYLRKNPDIVYAYAKQILHFCAMYADKKSMETAQKEMGNLIRKTLNQCWHSNLATLYGTLPFNQINRQLVIVGAWLKMYGERPPLLLLQGRLCMQMQLWGKAKDYFEKCLAQGPQVEVVLEYGRLLEQLGETDIIVEKYHDCLLQLATAKQMENVQRTVFAIDE